MGKHHLNSEEISSVMTDKSNFKAPKTWNNVEPEMLVNVLVKIYSPTNPREMSSIRLVCKHWRDVMDEHFDYRLTINDAKSAVKGISHLRVSHCTITNLTTELDPNKPLLCNPSALSTLFLWGEILPRNFQIIMEQATNLKKLSFNDMATQTPGLMDVPKSEESSANYESWNGLNTLEISLQKNFNQATIIDNLSKILSKRMENLGTLKLRVQLEPSTWEMVITSLFSLLERSNQLKVLHFFWFDVKMKMRSSNLQPPINFQGQLYLEVLRLNLVYVELPTWAPFIRSQQSLKDLRISFEFDICESREKLQLFLQVLRAALEKNQSTLTRLHISKFFLHLEFDFAIFQNFQNLKQLVFQPWHLESLFKIQNATNLQLLPESIEILVLGKIKVNSEDLWLLVNRLENIKEVQLVGTKVTGDFFMKEVFESLTQKPMIRKMTVNPLDGGHLARIPCEISENGKQFFQMNGFKIEILGRGITPFVDFTFPKLNETT